MRPRPPLPPPPTTRRIWEVDDALWADLQPLLVIDKPRKKPGRPRNDDRPIFNGLIWLARTGAQWEELPAPVRPQVDRPRPAGGVGRARLPGGGLGAAAGPVRRRDRPGVGVAGRRRLHRQGPARAKRGAPARPRRPGRNPTDRGKCGVQAPPADRRAGRAAGAGAVGGQPHRHEEAGRPAGRAADRRAGRGRAPHLCLDRGYDYAACRATAAAHGYTPHIPPKASAAQPLPPPGHPDRHPPRRWVVEVGHSWFNRFRRLLDPLGQAGGPLPRLRPTGRLPHHLSQAPPCPTTFRIGCKAAWRRLRDDDPSDVQGASRCGRASTAAASYGSIHRRPARSVGTSAARRRVRCVRCSHGRGDQRLPTGGRSRCAGELARSGGAPT